MSEDKGLRDFTRTTHWVATMLDDTDMLDHTISDYKKGMKAAYDAGYEDGSNEDGGFVGGWDAYHEKHCGRLLRLHLLLLGRRDLGALVAGAHLLRQLRRLLCVRDKVEPLPLALVVIIAISVPRSPSVESDFEIAKQVSFGTFSGCVIKSKAFDDAKGEWRYVVSVPGVGNHADARYKLAKKSSKAAKGSFKPKSVDTSSLRHRQQGDGLKAGDMVLVGSDADMKAAWDKARNPELTATDSCVSFSSGKKKLTGNVVKVTQVDTDGTIKVDDGDGGAWFP